MKNLHVSVFEIWNLEFGDWDFEISCQTLELSRSNRKW